MNKVLSMIVLCILCIAATQPGGCSSTQKVPKTESGAISRLSDAAQDITRDSTAIISDADSIRKEAVKANTNIGKAYDDPSTSIAAKAKLDLAIDSVAEIKSHSDALVSAGQRIQAETAKIETVSSRIEDLEQRVTELEDLEREGRAAAMQKLYGYITMFWVIGFIVIAGGVAMAFFANKRLGILVMIVGGVMIAFASASQYYLKEVALIGGILLGALVVGGLGFLLWSIINGNRSQTAMKEVIEMIEILKETMTDGERDRIFGENGVASHVQSDFTKEIIAKIKEKNGFKKLEQARNIARTETQPEEGQTP